MFGISGTELFLILLFAFLIFGPDKLPQIGRTIGRAVRQFRNAQDEMNRVVRTEIYDPIMDDEPLKNPAEILTGKKKTDKRKVKTVDEGTGTETFAERRARLARERAEREAAAAERGDAAAAKAESDVAEPAGTSDGDKKAPSTSDSGAHGSAKPAAATKGAGAETFAERRARLARERQVRERQAAEKAVPGGEDAAKADAEGGAASQADSSQAAGRSVADSLYGVDADHRGGDEADKA